MALRILKDIKVYVLCLLFLVTTAMLGIYIVNKSQLNKKLIECLSNGTPKISELKCSERRIKK